MQAPKRPALLNQYALNVHSGAAGAALQIAIWEVLYDTASPSYSLNSGDFMVTSYPSNSNVESLATAYLNSLGSNTSEAIWLDSYGYNASGIREQAGQDYGVPVPEPGMLCSSGRALPQWGWLSGTSGNSAYRYLSDSL